MKVIQIGSELQVQIYH